MGIRDSPNLDILDDLLDDEELYTELMCSNFKLLVFFRYPEVLARLVDYVTNEHVLEPADDSMVDEEQQEGENGSDSSDNDAEEDQGKQGSPEAEADSGDDLENSEDENNTQSQYQNTLDVVPDNASESSAETSITLPPESEEQVESRRARIAAEILSCLLYTSRCV